MYIQTRLLAQCCLPCKEHWKSCRATETAGLPSSVKKLQSPYLKSSEKHVQPVVSYILWTQCKQRLAVVCVAFLLPNQLSRPDPWCVHQYEHYVRPCPICIQLFLTFCRACIYWAGALTEASRTWKIVCHWNVPGLSEVLVTWIQWHHELWMEIDSHSKGRTSQRCWETGNWSWKVGHSDSIN